MAMNAQNPSRGVSSYSPQQTRRFKLQTSLLRCIFHASSHSSAAVREALAWFRFPFVRQFLALSSGFPWAWDMDRCRPPLQKVHLRVNIDVVKEKGGKEGVIRIVEA